MTFVNGITKIVKEFDKSPGFNRKPPGLWSMSGDLLK